MEDFIRDLDALYQEGEQQKIESFLHTRLSELRAGGEEAESVVALNELGSFYRGVSRYGDSEEAFLQALKILESLGLSCTAQHATVLINYAGLKRLRGRHEEAIDLFLKAESTFSVSGLTESYAYASVLNNLALVYLEVNELETALSHAERALVLMEGCPEAGVHETAISLNNLATITMRLGRLDRAEDHICQALELYDRMSSPNVHHAAALNTWGTIAYRREDFAASADAFRKSRDLTERFFGRNVEYDASVRNLDAALAKLGQRQDRKAE